MMAFKLTYDPQTDYTTGVDTGMLSDFTQYQPMAPSIRQAARQAAKLCPPY